MNPIFFKEKPKYFNQDKKKMKASDISSTFDVKVSNAANQIRDSIFKEIETAK